MPYFNEWYHPGQQYVKLSVAHDTLCRVYIADLQAAGVTNLTALTRQSLQLFYRGQEVPVFAQDSLNGGGLHYFEFIGRRNDGLLDSLLYRQAINPFAHDPTQQTDSFSSLFTDTSAYFLTWDQTNTQSYSGIATTNVGGRTPEASFRYRTIYEYWQSFFQGGGGSFDVNYVLNPDYVTGEGMLSTEYDANSGPLGRNIPTPGYAAVGNPTRIEARIIGVNYCPEHIFSIEVGQVSRHRDTTAFINIGTFGFDYMLPLPPLTIIGIQALGPATDLVDKQRAAWLTVEYDRQFDLGGAQSMLLRNWNHTDTTYLRFYHSEFDSTAYIYDLARKERISALIDGDSLKFLVPGHPSLRDLYFFSDKAIAAPDLIAMPALHNLSDIGAGAEFVIVTHRKFANSAQRYADYRATNNYNQLSTKVVYVDEIYDEFGYGSLTPWAIKNFCRYALDAWTIKPKHFMLWGKGRNSPRLDNQENYVPTFGTPANDWEYVTNRSYDSIDFVPAAGLGRVSLYNDAQGIDYLNKVMDYEQQPYSATYKNTLLMGGGKILAEQQGIFDANVNLVAPLLTGDPMNGNVFWYQKRNNGFDSNNPLTTEQHINAGLGVLHFFGHSAVNLFELDILEPNRYTNFHKYPFMIALGCSGGNFNEYQQSYGERTILEKDRGSIAYLGNTTSGFLSPLKDYAKVLYRVMMQEQYGASLGEIFQATIASYASEHFAGQNIYYANNLKQLDLQGDPSVRLKFPLKPDLRMRSADIYFPDGNPRAFDPTFNMNLVVHNDGRSFTDSFAVRITQRLPSGLIHVHNLWYQQPIANTDTLSLTLPNAYGLLSAGFNHFTVELDVADSIQEIIEDSNNVAEVDQLFFGNLATPLFPAAYAIVGEKTIFLQASAFLMNLAAPIDYSFEIDTTPSFDSPLKRTSSPISGTAALGQWPIGFDMTPQQVYYWRVRMSNFYPAQWIVSSFKYIPDVTGWSQSREPQMLENKLEDLILDVVNHSWDFGTKREVLHALIQSFGSPGKASYFLGPYGSQGEAGNGVFCVPIDHKTLVPLVRATFYGDWLFSVAPNSPTGPQAVTTVSQTIAQMQNGDYFLMATSGNARLPNWADDIVMSLEQVGGSYASLRAVQDGERLLFLGVKGGIPGSAILIVVPNLAVTGQYPMHDLQRTLSAPLTQGEIKSTVIGPTDSWGQLTADWATRDPFTGDTLTLSVYGIRNDLSEDLLRTQLDARSLHQLSSIDAQTYPRLRLQAHVRDDLHGTAPQLKKWEVYHAAVPDLAIDNSIGAMVPDSIEEGQPLHVRAFARNVTSVVTDSVWVRFALQKADRTVIELGRRRFPPFLAKEVKSLEYTTHTAGRGLEQGEMTMIIELNPGEETVEQYHFNNLYFQPIKVKTDAIGPLVDVTIDGKHLMADDIVSPEPEIVIQINDDNSYLPVSVSDSTFRIWFGTETIYTNNPMVTIEGNDSIEKGSIRMPENKTKLVFKPGKLADGQYTLAVQGYDSKGNVASQRPYVIQMTVVNQKSISQVLPYPNPFSSACRFAYTLTGDEKPSRFDIEIYTITGRLVKVVDLLAAGDVHFGYNITQYAWDGRDEYGDQLANGVYVYKVNTRFHDQSNVTIRDEGISDLFRNGYGKMYLMR